MYTSEFEDVKIALDTALERDMDLLIIEEMLSNREFTSLFLNAVGIATNSEIVKIQHSLRSKDGESDIFVILCSADGEEIHLHIENKVNADAQPEQYKRYIERAKEIANGKKYKICITAPQEYLEINSEAQKYQNKDLQKGFVIYEDIRKYFESKKDARSKYKIALINCALEKKDKTIIHESKEVTNFWDELDRLAIENGLKISSNQQQHGKESKFIRFKTKYKGVFVTYKARHGNVDLEIPNPFGTVSLPSELLPEHVSVVNFKKTVAIRISNPKYILNLEEDINCNKEIVEEILSCVKELTILCENIAKGRPDIIG